MFFNENLSNNFLVYAQILKKKFKRLLIIKKIKNVLKYRILNEFLKLLHAKIINNFMTNFIKDFFRYVSKSSLKKQVF